MAKFAKLAEDGDRQVVAIVCADDEGNASVRFSFEAEGAFLEAHVSQPGDSKEHWDTVDRVFDDLTDAAMFEVADKFTEQARKMMGLGEDEQLTEPAHEHGEGCGCG